MVYKSFAVSVYLKQNGWQVRFMDHLLMSSFYKGMIMFVLAVVSTMNWLLVVPRCLRGMQDMTQENKYQYIIIAILYSTLLSIVCVESVETIGKGLLNSKYRM